MARSVKKRLYIFLGVLLCILLITEIVLRQVFGFCDAVLSRNDPDYEYIAIPQTRYRFRNHIFYNSFSQRNEEPGDSTFILGFGDSVINGGTPTDQDSLATTHLTNYLTNKYTTPHLVTNISAGSWGPDNCYAYLKKHGNFGAKSILLIVSSHDAYDNMDFASVVGEHPDMPGEQYPLAIYELIDRYLIPRIFGSKVENQSPGINKQTVASHFNSGFENFNKYSDSTGIPLTVYLHADKNELNSGNYNQQGMEIINFCSKENIRIIKELDYKLAESAYRDNIHLSEEGQRKMFEILKAAF